jgi:hypothetical protein
VQAGAARFKLHVYGYIVMPEHVHLLLSEPQRDASSDGTCASTNSEALAVVFTIGQINDLRARLGSTKTLVEYLRGLRTLGVERYDFYLADGHSEYFGRDGHTVVSPPDKNREQTGHSPIFFHSPHVTSNLAFTPTIARS